MKIDAKLSACEHSYTACATFVPSVTLRPSATASATLLVSAGVCMHLCLDNNALFRPSFSKFMHAIYIIYNYIAVRNKLLVANYSMHYYIVHDTLVLLCLSWWYREAHAMVFLAQPHSNKDTYLHTCIVCVIF